MKTPKPKLHPRIEEARKLDHVVVLCCGYRRPNLSERDIEQAILEFLWAERWAAMPVVAEVTNTARRAPKGSLDLVAYEPLWKSIWLGPWWIEVKAGDRDLTPEQLTTVKNAPCYGVRVIICDEVSLLQQWMKERK